MKQLTLLLCLLAVVAISASAATPTLSLTPSAVVLLPGATQNFTASFSDNSTIQNCIWLTTGAPNNSVQANGGNNSSATFAAGSTPGQYVVTAFCSNTNGVSAMGIAGVSIN